MMKPPVLDSPESATTPRRVRASLFRQLIDSLVCLAIAVILFRTFQVEGYMISTGSMAPTLLGYHKQVVCPTCHYQFAWGVEYDDDYDQAVADENAAVLRGEKELVTCPNCGQSSIDVSQVPRNQGDQILVSKSSFALEPPHRFEVVVFRNPQEPLQAYVKRIGGLPGERIQVRNGDLYINGELARKDWELQQAIRIPVYDHRYEPKEDPSWQPRWVPNPGEVEWQPEEQRFLLKGTSLSQGVPSEMAWLTYSHWVRSGGTFETSVPLSLAPQLREAPSPLFRDDGEEDEIPLDMATPMAPLPVAYHPDRHLLVCTGVMPEYALHQLLNRNSHPVIQEAIRELYEQSHLSPVTDYYGYNRWQGNDPPQPVRDLMISMQVIVQEGTGSLVVQMDDGQRLWECVLDYDQKTVTLQQAGGKKALQSVPLPEIEPGTPFSLEMSLIDRQILVAINQIPLWKPYIIEEQAGEIVFPRRPVRIGGQGLQVELENLVLYRDVYYTHGRGAHAITEPYQLGPKEYFMLGDNSPVSSDSRCWDNPTVHQRLLLGKPFLVHLPSRPGKLKIGDWSTHIRVPDFSRVRYIR